MGNPSPSSQISARFIFSSKRISFIEEGFGVEGFDEEGVGEEGAEGGARFLSLLHPLLCDSVCVVVCESGYGGWVGYGFDSLKLSVVRGFG